MCSMGENWLSIRLSIISTDLFCILEFIYLLIPVIIKLTLYPSGYPWPDILLGKGRPDILITGAQKTIN